MDFSVNIAFLSVCINTLPYIKFLFFQFFRFRLEYKLFLLKLFSLDFFLFFDKLFQIVSNNICPNVLTRTRSMTET